MTDPFMLDQREVELSLNRLRDSVGVWRRLRATRDDSGANGWTEALEYQFQGLDGTVRNSIRDVKWSLAELEETLELLTRHEDHFAESDDLNSRRIFLENSRESLARMEAEMLAPSVKEAEQCEGEQRTGAITVDDASDSADEESDCRSQERPCVGGPPGKTKKKKSVSWHRHVKVQRQQQQQQQQQQQTPPEAEVRIRTGGIKTACGKLRRLPSQLMKHRLWISIAVTAALFLLVLLVISVSKANRRLAEASAAVTTDTQTTPK